MFLSWISFQYSPQTSLMWEEITNKGGCMEEAKYDDTKSRDARAPDRVGTPQYCLHPFLYEHCDI